MTFLEDNKSWCLTVKEVTLRLRRRNQYKLQLTQDAHLKCLLIPATHKGCPQVTRLVSLRVPNLKERDVPEFCSFIYIWSQPQGKFRFFFFFCVFTPLS